MNKIIYYILILITVSCSADYIGQYPVDDVPPGKVSNAIVTNFPGGSEITYDLPNDEDVLYVKAQYTRPNGENAEERVSFILNSLKVKGFSKSQKTNIKLIAVDRSENESDPLLVEIEPEDSPIYNILSSINIEATWGGLKVSWQNPIMENIVVSLISKTSDDTEYSVLENFYSAGESITEAVRGMDSINTNVGVFVRDRYKNYTDTIYNDYRPFFEQQLNSDYFKGLPQSPDYPLHATYGSADLNVLWDNAIQPDKNVYYIAPSGTPNPYFTMDLGVVAKLSRFSFWSRQNWVFQLHSPKHFEVWGTSNESATAADNWDGWVKLLDQEAYRPSGLPAGTTPTADDIAYAAAGEEYEFDISNPTVRFIRFRCIETWGGSTGLNLTEIAFWGAPQN